MAFFDELGKSISGAGQSAVKQAKDVADITRLSALLSENKSQISVINRQIGEKYFELFREAAGDEFTELVEKEKELLAENVFGEWAPEEFRANFDKEQDLERLRMIYLM